VCFESKPKRNCSLVCIGNRKFLAWTIGVDLLWIFFLIVTNFSVGVCVTKEVPKNLVNFYIATIWSLNRAPRRQDKTNCVFSKMQIRVKFSNENCTKICHFKIIKSSSHLRGKLFPFVSQTLAMDLVFRSAPLFYFLFYTVQKKNTHSHFLSYLHEWCVDLYKNCSEYTRGKVDTDNVEISYSLRPMTLWRHNLSGKSWGKFTARNKPWAQDIIFCEYTGYTCWCVDAVVSCIMRWNLRQFNIKQLFIHKPD